jgi:hypothetical protein
VLQARGRVHDAAQLREGAYAEATALGLAPLAARASARPAAPAREVEAAPAPEAADVTLVSEGDVWIVAGAGERCRLKDSRGLHMLKKLVDQAGRELHALELAGDGGLVDGGAGPPLDERAKAAYRARLRELRAEEEEASEWNDSERQARASAELDRLTQELSRALGLGGRDRKQGSSVERARVNAQRRLTDAIKRIGESCPKLGRHLAATVRTGTFCWYDPASRKRPSD